MNQKVLRVGHLGDGFLENGLLADRVLPDEIVSGVSNEGRLEEIKIIRPSGFRIKPACPAYNRCGGCGLQHAKNEFVETWKVRCVQDAVESFGLKAPLRRLHVSPEKSRRRSKFSGRRTKSAAVVGFHGRRSNMIVNIDGCTVLTPVLSSLVAELEDFTKLFGTRKGTLDFWCLDTGSEVDVAVDCHTQLDGKLAEQIAIWSQSSGISRLVYGDEKIFEKSLPKLDVGGVYVEPPPRAFAQATKSGERAIQTSVAEAVGQSKRVADLFSGFGTLSLPLVQTTQTIGFEFSKPLVAAHQAALRNAPSHKNCSAEQRDLFRNPLSEVDFEKFDAAIVDPARSGAMEQCKSLAKSAVKNIAMVSCNPQTFARDVSVLVSGGYKIDWIDVVDQFRWSHHIEVAAKLTR